ncbi:hypothetical protein C0995_009838 [Termitomyces sp. Mi166|nr:hypothetical protein C0995_009838 [Termitomyces sp. Mi166\
MVQAVSELQEEPKRNEAHKSVAEVEKAIDLPKVNGSEITASATDGIATHPKRRQIDVDPEAQQMVIDSLRLQVQDLFSQVNQLNNKLVTSYDRVSDLEDDLHVASEANRSSSLKISQLESEREQHLSALNTGILVEKSQVTAELTRLMEKATEEAAQRGQAENARQAIEKDLDDLSATLFGQANTMVAEARIARHESEQKVEVAERNMKSAEEAVAAMQQQIQVLRAEKEEAERKAEASQVALDMTVGKDMGKHYSKNPTPSLRLLSSHSPYQEFMLFVAHLRSVHSSSSQPPAISSLLPLPFLARLLTEDSEPTIRLDLAPSLNWLSRRSVLAAIHNGQLIIEPMSLTTFLQEVNHSGSTISGNISCALCGTSIFSTPIAGHNATLPLPPVLTQSNSGSNSWSASLFKKPSAINYSISTNNSTPSTPTSRPSSFQHVSPSQVYIFKLATPTSSTSSIPIPSLPRTTNSSASSPLPTHTHTDSHASYTSSANPQPSSTIYPLCTNDWCLSRLRSTCSLWAFVRSGIVEKIWEEEVPTLPTKPTSPTGEKPPIPPRRRGLWSMASALGERAASWGEGEKDKAKRAKTAEKTPSSTPPAIEPKSNRRRLPPPLPPKATTITLASTSVKPAVPPPLPKRSEVRHTTPPVASTEKSATSTSTEAQEELPALVASTETPSESPAAALVSDAQPQIPTPAPTPVETSAVPEATDAKAEPPSGPAETHATDIVPPDTTAAAVTQEPKLPPRPPRRPMNPESRPHTPPMVNTPAPGTPAPPPLPRRAANRASRVPADSGIPSRTPTPAEPIAESKVGDVDQASKKGDSEQTGSSVSDAVFPADGVKEEKLTVTELNKSAVVSPSVEEEVFVDAESGSESGEEGAADKEVDSRDKAGVPEGGKEVEKMVEEKAEEVEEVEEKVEEKTDEVEKAEEKFEEKADKVEKAQDRVEGKVEETKEKPEAKENVEETETDEKTQEETETSAAKMGPEGDEMDVVSPDAQSTDKQEAEKDTDDSKKLPVDDSSGNYVGDATWEERTWKEVIRLKEAMFWARIGGLKQKS